MRHQKAGRKLGRNSSHRKAMFRNMVTSLIDLGGIITTDAKAKELRRVADRMITLGKKQTVAARRQAPRFMQREGGYTRIIKLGRRKGDNAALSRIEFTEQAATPESTGD